MCVFLCDIRDISWPSSLRSHPLVSTSVPKLISTESKSGGVPFAGDSTLDGLKPALLADGSADWEAMNEALELDQQFPDMMSLSASLRAHTHAGVRTEEDQAEEDATTQLFAQLRAIRDQEKQRSAPAEETIVWEEKEPTPMYTPHHEDEVDFARDRELLSALNLSKPETKSAETKSIKTPCSDEFLRLFLDLINVDPSARLGDDPNVLKHPFFSNLTTSSSSFETITDTKAEPKSVQTKPEPKPDQTKPDSELTQTKPDPKTKPETKKSKGKATPKRKKSSKTKAVESKTEAKTRPSSPCEESEESDRADPLEVDYAASSSDDDFSGFSYTNHTLLANKQSSDGS